MMMIIIIIKIIFNEEALLAMVVFSGALTKYTFLYAV